MIQSFAVPNLWKEEDLFHILGNFGCLIIERTGANVHDFLLTNDSLHVHRVSFLSSSFSHTLLQLTTNVRSDCRKMCGLSSNTFIMIFHLQK